MEITKEVLVKHHLDNLVGWFESRFPAGVVEYQTLLDQLVEENRAKDADWVLRSIGPDREVTVEVDRLTGKDRFFAGGLVVKGEVALTGFLHAGGGITVAGDCDAAGIYAGGGIAVTDCLCSRSYMIAREGKITAGELTAGDVTAAGDVIVDGDVEVFQGIKAANIKVGGHLMARAVYAVNSVDVRKDIRSHTHLWAGGGVTAGDSIDAGRNIRAGGGVTAGGDVTAGWGVTAGAISADGLIRARVSVRVKGAIRAQGGVIAPEVVVDPNVDVAVFIA